MSWGKFYGIGVGPGDPELLTLKAKRILEQVELLFVPKSRLEKRSVAYSIVSQVVDKPWQCIELLLPMTADPETLSQHWQEAAGVVIEQLSSGRDGAFITLGDPTLFSTFTYLLKYIKQAAPAVEVEIVPGISAVNSISAVLQEPLAEGEENLVIIPALQDQETLARLAGQFDNIVLMKAGRQIDKICSVLEQNGSNRQARLVSRCGFEEVFMSDDIFALKGQDLDYLSTVIIKKKTGGVGQ